MAVRSRPKRTPHFTQEVITSLQVRTTSTWRSALTIITYQQDWLREPFDETYISACINSPRTRFCKLKSVTMGNFFPMSPQCQSPNLRKRLWGEWVRGVAVYLHFQKLWWLPAMHWAPHSAWNRRQWTRPPSSLPSWTLQSRREFLSEPLVGFLYTRDSGGRLVCLSSYAYYTLRAINVYSYFFFPYLNQGHGQSSRFSYELFRRQTLKCR